MPLAIRFDSSGQSSARWSRSGIGAPSAAEIFTAQGPSADPLAALASLLARHRRHNLAGFFSYDLGLTFEPFAQKATDDLHLPLFALAAVPSLQPPAGEPPQASVAQRSGRVRSTFSRAGYLAAVRRALDYISAGDVFQINLSQRFTVAQTATPLQIYQRLTAHAPAAFGALLDFGDFALICNSPELFFRVIPLGDGRRKIITRPIKGTRPRMAGMAEQLRDSPKDQAELNMIIDLERNDLGRLCEIGSVKVAEPRTIETHPTVYHGVATIEGMLRPDVGFVEILRAMLPGGSITGAPKIRAMQIIDELEPVRRGPYCGAIGYLAADGSMEFNIAIRTMIVKEGRVHIPVGGGIVADSDPAAEYEETLVKARAMFAALGVEMLDLP